MSPLARTRFRALASCDCFDRFGYLIPLLWLSKGMIACPRSEAPLVFVSGAAAPQLAAFRFATAPVADAPLLEWSFLRGSR
jgi:hypothetical protein